MKRKIFFTPGPAAIYPGVEQFMQEAFEQQITSISHRSNTFRSIYQDTFEHLKALLSIPEGFAILFTGSATEIWERIMMNCVAESSLHLVNGSFSKRFYQTAQLLHKSAHKVEAPLGEGFEPNKIQVDYKAELIALTHNETSMGVAMPSEDIHSFREAYPNRIIAVDMVSSAPYPNLDFQKVDTAFFSVQKGFGLPAGLGVWIVNEQCLAKAEALENKGLVTGTYHRLTNMWAYFEKFECPCTPNVLGIYLLGRVAKAMLEKGIQKIRKETEEKAKMLYDFFEADERFNLFVKNAKHRSATVVVANTVPPAKEIIEGLSSQGLQIGTGYRAFKAQQIRVANFPAVSLEDVEQLIQALKKC